MRAKREKIKESQLVGFKYFKMLSGLLERLHDAGCQRDRAHNRILHMDQHVSLLLLYMFNPICTSLRALQQASELEKVQRLLGCARASLGSLSESARVFDSDLLKEIIEELSDQLPNVSRIPGFEEKKGILTAVDGTLVEAVAKMAWATWQTDRNGIKVHTQFEILKGVPVEMDVSDANSNEKAVLSQKVQAGRIYVLDRGYAKYGLFQDILQAHSSFICRIRDNAIWQEMQDNSLSEKAIAADVVFDKTVILGGENTTVKLSPIRLIGVTCTPNVKQHHTARGGPEQGEILWIATDRFDLEAETIATIYKRRWTVEIFFRFFKHVLGCRHLLSYNQNGIELQVYAAIIACMLISLWTGKKPTLRTYEMICWYFTGMASEDELLAHIRESMTESEIEILLQQAKEKFPQTQPRIISDNGPQFIAKDFKEFIRLSGMTHVRTSPYYPQSNGKLERYHKTIKGDCIRVKTPLSLEDAQRCVADFVRRYNTERLHSAIGYITPLDKLEGRAESIQAQRERKLAQAREARKALRKAS